VDGICEVLGMLDDNTLMLISLFFCFVLCMDVTENLNPIHLYYILVKHRYIQSLGRSLCETTICKIRQ
jgi:hypothetical protein